VVVVVVLPSMDTASVLPPLRINVAENTVRRLAGRHCITLIITTTIIAS